LAALRASDKEDLTASDLQRELAKAESEVESIKLKITEHDKNAKENTEKSNELQKQHEQVLKQKK